MLPLASCVATALAGACLSGGVWAQQPADRLAERIAHAPWEFSRLKDDEELAQALSYLRRAKSAGFTGVVLSNTAPLAQPSRSGPEYVARLRALGDEAARLKLDLIPMVMNFGDGGAVLGSDPNLAEGVPVRDALFVVSGREARLVPDPPITIENPGFEQPEGNHFPGWTDEKELAGKAIFADTETRHSGECSMRLDCAATPEPYGWGWVAQDILVKPFRLYRAKLWIRTDQIDRARDLKAAIWTGKRHLHYGSLGVEATQDWRCHELTFNSLDNSRVSLRVGSDGGPRQGGAWFDDVSIEEIGLLTVIRRSGCPLSVRGEDGTVYEEGRDFEPVSDPLLGRLHPWGGFSFSHEPPAIRLTPDSRITDRQRLRASFYHAVAVYGQQVSLCLSHAPTYDLFAQGVRELQDALRPAGYHISVGEIRTANWDEDCAKLGLTPGELLVESIKRRIAIVREVNQQARVYAWSDMLDPWHNAVDNYYLCHGTWAGAAASVPRDLVIINWNFTGHEGKSPRYFADLGFRQLLLGGAEVRTWLDANPDVRGIIGAYAFEARDPEEYARLWRAAQ